MFFCPEDFFFSELALEFPAFSEELSFARPLPQR
jgi:hypothetical protein